MDDQIRLIREGGPAFPSGIYLGMSLRDYFAAKAICGLLSNSNFNNLSFDEINSLPNVVYHIADKMLEARNK